MRFLGLDLSLAATGWVCSCGDGGTFHPKNLRGMERIVVIAGLVESHTPHVDLVVIEGYSFGAQGRANTLTQLGELGGVIRYGLYHDGLPWVEVAPAALKKFATGKGNAGKDEVLVAGVRRFDFPGDDNNHADAWILHRMAQARYAADFVPTIAQREALAKIDWPAYAAVPDV